MYKKNALTAIFLLLVILVFGQSDYAYVAGTLRDSSGTPFTNANVRVIGTNKGTSTNEKGKFKLVLEANKSYALEISHLQLANSHYHSLDPLKSGSQNQVDIVLPRGAIGLKEISFEEERSTKGTFSIKLDPLKIKTPNASGDISTLIKTLPGVNSSNELSTQYSVRGGNFDENLVYINGIEIYRPFLVRTGRSEGLSIINTNMVKSLNFSAGGFDAYYGDKLSSVLDITYKQPDSFAASVQGSFLGGGFHVEGVTKNKRWRYLASGRYRSNSYLLNSLDVQGDYNPVFADFQSYITYRWVKSSLSWLSYYGGNTYQTSPLSQTTKFGTVRDPIQIDVFYEGQEITEYRTILNALLYEYVPTDSMKLQLSVTNYNALENERFDVLGQYFLSQLDNEIGSETFGDPKYTLGVGSYLNHARNYLNANIFNVQHRGEWFKEKHAIAWGAKFQYDQIADELKEWSYLDSAGYSVPLGPEQTIDLNDLVVSSLELQTQRYTAYAQDHILLNEDKNARLNVGIRTNYWDYNNQWLIAPRLNFSIEPNRAHNRHILKNGLSSDSLKRNIRIKFAAGFYQQPPFYRELRTKSGELVEGVKAQQSMHLVAGADWNFDLWERESPFKFSGELYYKHMWDLIPYEIENVRIRYLPEFTAEGYAYGADFHVNGEFIPELPSWFSFSLMNTRENIEGDTYVDTAGNTTEKGWMARPTDQRYSFNILFQDFLKDNELYRVHLNLVFAHGLPFGPPGYPQFRNELRVPPYRRVDIGFSKVLFDKRLMKTPSKLLNFTDHIMLSAEIFNLFGIRNTVSHLWVKDIFNRQFSVPTYLTSRRFSLELQIRI